jgi:hypothetical protein
MYRGYNGLFNGYNPYFAQQIQQPQWNPVTPQMRRLSAENYQDPGYYPYGNDQRRQVIQLPAHHPRRDENLTFTQPKSNFFQASKHGSEPSVRLMNLQMYQELVKKYKMLGPKHAKQLADREYDIILNERSYNAQKQKQLDESPAYQEALRKAIKEARERGQREAAPEMQRYRAQYGSGNFIHKFKIPVDFSDRNKYPNFNPKDKHIQNQITHQDIDGLADRAVILQVGKDQFGKDQYEV